MGIKLIQVDQFWLTENVNSNCFFKDSVPVRGVRFNFSAFLNTYLVKQFGSWQEYKAYNKTSLRAFIHGKIDKIVQINTIK